MCDLTERFAGSPLSALAGFDTGLAVCDATGAIDVHAADHPQPVLMSFHRTGGTVA
jgi:hypothetical protein